MYRILFCVVCVLGIAGCGQANSVQPTTTSTKEIFKQAGAQDIATAGEASVPKKAAAMR